uniref:Uncharacterized protein n=1 Tax=Picea sitchensis TaxID=3332 RepID=A9NPV8_PICSI|nr:unknown [Picea sitchensis]
MNSWAPPEISLKRRKRATEKFAGMIGRFVAFTWSGSVRMIYL